MDQITVGNIITVAVILFGAVSAWAYLKSDVEALKREVKALNDQDLALKNDSENLKKNVYETISSEVTNRDNVFEILKDKLTGLDMTSKLKDQADIERDRKMDLVLSATSSIKDDFAALDKKFEKLTALIENKQTVPK